MPVAATPSRTPRTVPPKPAAELKASGTPPKADAAGLLIAAGIGIAAAVTQKLLGRHREKHGQGKPPSISAAPAAPSAAEVAELAAVQRRNNPHETQPAAEATPATAPPEVAKAEAAAPTEESLLPGLFQGAAAHARLSPEAAASTVQAVVTGNVNATTNASDLRRMGVALFKASQQKRPDLSKFYPGGTEHDLHTFRLFAARNALGLIDLAGQVELAQARAAAAPSAADPDLSPALAAGRQRPTDEQINSNIFLTAAMRAGVPPHLVPQILSALEETPPVLSNALMQAAFNKDGLTPDQAQEAEKAFASYSAMQLPPGTLPALAKTFVDAVLKDANPNDFYGTSNPQSRSDFRSTMLSTAAALLTLQFRVDDLEDTRKLLATLAAPEPKSNP